MSSSPMPRHMSLAARATSGSKLGSGPCMPSYTHALRAELAPSGVGVTLLSPGATSTSFAATGGLEAGLGVCETDNLHVTYVVMQGGDGEEEDGAVEAEGWSSGDPPLTPAPIDLAADLALLRVHAHRHERRGVGRRPLLDVLPLLLLHLQNLQILVLPLFSSYQFSFSFMPIYVFPFVCLVFFVCFSVCLSFCQYVYLLYLKIFYGQFVLVFDRKQTHTKSI